MISMDYLVELRKNLELVGEKDEDIRAACEYAENLLKLGLPVIFNREHLAILLGCSNTDLSYISRNIESKYYHRMYIPKKDGQQRELMIPAVRLRAMQRWILDNILYEMPVSKYSTGFVKQKSIVANAASHVGKDCIINVDIKDFFPSITRNQVYRIFYYYGYTDQVSFILSRLCTAYDKLPQGAPTSPYISNIVCLKMDKRLSKLAESFGCAYTRYADDITVSGNYGIGKILPLIKSIINDEGFILNENKTRIQYSYQRQEITGLVVNDRKIRVNSKYKKKFKQEIYYCKRFGVRNHLEHIHVDKAFYKEHMYGKAYFIKMIEPEVGKALLLSLDEIDWES